MYFTARHTCRKISYENIQQKIYINNLLWNDNQVELKTEMKLLAEFFSRWEYVPLVSILRPEIIKNLLSEPFAYQESSLHNNFLCSYAEQALHDQKNQFRVFWFCRKHPELLCSICLIKMWIKYWTYLKRFIPSFQEIFLCFVQKRFNCKQKNFSLII